ncbi:hypothetical protein [Exiguobacterium sp. ERU656]|uniref:hypothetical protein n=1 Tax=Exiguobacterium sp. ERU656 TaxID=2751217 RepID=UPI001BE67363|nr:hypothetical protein [Exiguobacterium sp. ERU656]
MEDKLKTEIGTLISDFKDKVNEWNENYRDSNIQFIYNENLDQLNASSIKYILVGDNPGVKEKEHNKYLIGATGLIARSFFKSELEVSDFNNEVLILNKTPIHSAKTSGLSEICKSSNMDLLQVTQEYMCNLIYNLQNLLNCEVIILGFGGCRINKKWDLKVQTSKKEKTMIHFFLKLREFLMSDKKFSENVFVAQHFSRGVLFKEMIKKIDDIENLNKKKFLEYCKTYTEEIRNSKLQKK